MQRGARLRVLRTDGRTYSEIIEEALERMAVDEERLSSALEKCNANGN